MNAYQQHLFDAFDFTPEDLQANRSGKMTISQQQKIKPSIADYTQKVMLTLVVVLICVVISIVDLTINQPAFTIFSDVDVPFMFIIGVVIVVLTVIFLFSFEVLVFLDARKAAVDAVNGIIKIHDVDAFPDTISKLKVRKETFGALSPEQLTIIQTLIDADKNQKVTVYCTPRTRKFLSIELI